MSKNTKKAVKPPIKLSASRDVVSVAPRHVSVKYQGKRDENGLRPSTSRALVLRNGKYGARGTGELMLASKISGREKLDLLAEDLLSRSKNAVMSPLRLETCVKIADSQFNAYLDDISNLQDPDLFLAEIKEELMARTPCSDQRGAETLENPTYIASVIATRIHNAYMLASAWKIVLDSLHDLQQAGLVDKTAQAQLKRDQSLRSQYLLLCDMVNVLADIGQKNFSVLATTTPHYAHYFKPAEGTDPDDPEMTFDWGALKDAGRSFLDSIIVELCFPHAPYPKRILYQILHDAIGEAPREAKRFPQYLWDAVGDLSITLQLQELLESTLFGPEGEAWKKLPRQMPEKYDQWIDAQIYSQQASNSHNNFKDLVHPLDKTKDKVVLENMWKHVNLNYKAVSSMNIDTLWQLDEALHRIPQWSSFYVPGLNVGSDSDSDAPPGLFRSKGRLPKATRAKGSKGRKLLAITDGPADDDSDGSMPGLQSVSDSTGDSDNYSDSDKEDMDIQDMDEDDDDDESGYDSEEEAEYRDMIREAMDTAMGIPEFFDPNTPVPELDAADGKRGNPFLKLLGSLRGRMFSSKTRLSTTARTGPLKDLFGKKPAPQKPTPPTQKDVSTSQINWTSVPIDDLPPLEPISGTTRLPRRNYTTPNTPAAIAAASLGSNNFRTTVEEVEDEDAADSSAKKKKKKKPKKKKVRPADGELAPVQEDIPSNTMAPAPSPSKPMTTSPPTSPPRTMPRRSSGSGGAPSIHSHMSTASLSLPLEQTTAQSSHSYLQEREGPKAKIKSRPDHASLFSSKRGFLSELIGSKSKTEAAEKSKKTKGSKHSWFSRLTKKTSIYMHQLLGTSEVADEKSAPMKWENFLKVMREMGFTYDPSTAGSSVRFDPPDPKDKSITFHKPHPDTTLHPIKLKEYGNRLKRYYGWSEEDFNKMLN
ncbi:hypothetical protein SERLA73DRAFT_167949 [Serpula lacrymans var. lacrymans S7.3]|uniref:Uncharacterized protein n=2 Tax=Serpula lacrymans var. lacrymans TaxID=341189 RepID=F8PV29_SERL3|nr:uncharacterized protein SERLADRAFT_437394 [Serpula lacrymans var. lacrymans S7.9]EGO00109.1 hypothetical protein SERLA73DRAFT_167949 [Serpula lacrymans var. lacrymans S7.3]EGO25670.1 hypothetical protein SERLADRAFT_437394 [Serpula lacrymans var. lacrymans S7.9]